MLAVVCAATIEMIPGALPVEPDLSREPVDRIGCQCYIKADLAVERTAAVEPAEHQIPEFPNI